MSPNTRSRTRDPRRPFAAVIIALSMLATGVATAMAERAPPLPASVLSLAPGLRAQGGGLLTYFGFSVYDGWYWSESRGWPEAGAIALDLHYHRTLEGGKIAQRSVEEIGALGYGTEREHRRWLQKLERIFPDVGSGDRLTGLSVDRDSVRFFRNGEPIGEIVEPGFARAFFGIWLDPKSSRADFRRKLLGQP